MYSLIMGTTTIVGVLGYPVAHSLSPLMHNAAFAEVGLDWVYVPFAAPPDTLATAVAGAVALGVRGVNVTIPHKQAVMSLVDRLTPEARAVGSVNTLVMTEDGVLGHSTDGQGFLRALTERGIPVAGTRAMVLGAGGAARAVVGALAAAGAAEVTVVARRPAQGAELAALAERLAPGRIRTHVLAWGADASNALENVELLVNTTPVGMTPHDPTGCPVPPAWLHDGLCVYDLIYTPRPTALLHAAAARGCLTIDGVAMLVYQGAEAFTLWTQCPAPIAVMEAVVSARLACMARSTSGAADGGSH